MVHEDDDEHLHRRDQLVELKRRYDADQNPRYALEAWRIARNFRLPIPRWVLNYIDSYATAFLDRTDDVVRIRGNDRAILKRPSKAKGGIARAIRAAAMPGPPINPFHDRFDRELEAKGLAAAVWLKLATGKLTETRALKEVADEKKTGKGAVRAAWLAHKFDLSMTHYVAPPRKAKPVRKR